MTIKVHSSHKDCCSYIICGGLKKTKKPRSEFAAGLKLLRVTQNTLPVIRQTQISLTKKEVGKAKAIIKTLLSCRNGFMHIISPEIQKFLCGRL
jgi:hypothetical protein